MMMTKRLSPFILLLVILFSCTPPIPIEYTATQIKSLSTDIEQFSSRAELLSVEVDEIIAQIGTPDVDWHWLLVQDGDWEPTNLDLVAMKRGLQAHVEAEARRQGVIARDWEGFTFQYQGSFDPERKIHLFALCTVRRSIEELEQEFANEISDGGTCYFGTSYDPETRKFSTVHFHGEA